MGYACPVCEAPQADGEHLANHLAITAIMGREGHEEWLDEHAPEWEDSTRSELAEAVVEHVPETEFPQLFEDTTDGHGHGGQSGATLEQEMARQTAGRGRGDLTDETRDVLAEARELTEEMLDAGEETTGAPDEE
ncbi:DUF5810 domain-containing protein [Natranaeroarchaeum sulfidigenes]|uniref:Uncharacterized protein n=1 Tax=Natranaeroarchaeum sulfidigenes TaxID=2784880 RepID=A0A897MXN8_9EURY|nr:DUF5810 domain-containing protein [Natranaeroarchaeum sulfidigenes]QSG03843.1 Uncharacterized protein AArcS_2647 [Natranaeroarchaeum sulfidigenes]